jgi:hypothetical protein
VRAKESIQLTSKFALRDVKVKIPRERVSVRYNVVVCEYKSTVATFDASDPCSSGVEEGTLTEMLECRVHRLGWYTRWLTAEEPVDRFAEERPKGELIELHETNTCANPILALNSRPQSYDDSYNALASLARWKPTIPCPYA